MTRDLLEREGLEAELRASKDWASHPCARYCRAIAEVRMEKAIGLANAVPIGLADAVRALRTELTAAMAAAADERVQFELGPVEMEFQLEVTTEGSTEAGIRFYVVTLGGKGARTRGSTHRVKLTLDPVDVRGGRRPRVAADAPTRPR